MVKNHNTMQLSRQSKWLGLFRLLLAVFLCAGVAYYSYNRFAHEGEEISEPVVQAQREAQPAGTTNIFSPRQESVIVYARLPVQAQEVYRLIGRGGSFEYRQDGTVFGNYEQRLPAQTRGYYREYTVKTPGVSHRGARRIVCGGEIVTRPQACYYTQDHYESFRQIVEVPGLH